MAEKQMPGYVFPNPPSGWTQDEKNFAAALRQLFDVLFARTRGMSGGFSRDSYESLKDKPSISNVILIGNRTLTDIGIHDVSASSHGLMTVSLFEKLNGIDVATEENDGLMPAAMYEKLDGIDVASDENDGLMPSEMYVKLDGIDVASDENDGLMPSEMYTKLDGIDTASDENDGLMPAAMYEKLDGIEEGATATPNTRPEVDYLSMMTEIPIPTDDSDKVEKVGGYYEDETWNKQMVWDAVSKQWISDDDYEDITGEPFPPFRPD